jgi:hypothetical protein
MAKTGPKCHTGTFLKDVGEADAAKVQAAVDSGQVAWEDLVKALAVFGYRGKAYSLSRHYRNRCSCADVQIADAELLEAKTLEEALMILVRR